MSESQIVETSKPEVVGSVIDKAGGIAEKMNRYRDIYGDVVLKAIYALDITLKNDHNTYPTSLSPAKQILYDLETGNKGAASNLIDDLDHTELADAEEELEKIASMVDSRESLNDAMTSQISRVEGRLAGRSAQNALTPGDLEAFTKNKRLYSEAKKALNQRGEEGY